MDIQQIADGEWYLLPKNTFKTTCCDCGLTHETQFRIMPQMKGDNKQILGIEARTIVLKEATEEARSQKTYLCLPKPQNP